MGERYLQAADTICHTAAEIDRRSLIEIFGRAGHLSYLVAFVEYLRYHLIVKYKVIRVRIQI